MGIPTPTVHRSQRAYVLYAPRLPAGQSGTSTHASCGVNADEPAGVPSQYAGLIQEGVPDARDRSNVQRAPQRFGEVCADAAEGIGVSDLVSAYPT
jgi:hypothetical protein